MVWVRSPVYFYKRNETFYFSRAIPSDLLHRFNKRKIEGSLRTKSEAKAAKSAVALSDRLERYWDSLRMEMIYSKELSLTVLPETRAVAADSFSLTDALALYHPQIWISVWGWGSDIRGLFIWLLTSKALAKSCVSYNHRYAVNIWVLSN